MRIETSLLIGLAALSIYEGARLTTIALPVKDPLGPGWYLLSISVLLLICSVIYWCVQFKSGVGKRRKGLSFHVGSAVQSLIVLTLYCIAVPLVGYIISTIFFFPVTIHIFGLNSWIKSIIIGLVYASAFFFTFSYLAGLPLP